MLARPFRLVKEADFARVMQKGRRYKVPEGQLKFIQNGLLKNRFGIIVSNKTARRANQRNLLKRRIREIIRKIAPELKSGFDVVFVAYPPIMEMDFAGLEKILTASFTRVGLTKKP